MTSTQLFMAPGTCARVSAIALEEIGEAFETVVVRFMKGEHKSPDYLRMNPKGKVPTLLIDGQTLTENVAIITYLNERNPEAVLLPKADPQREDAADALAIAVCHAHHRQSVVLKAAVR